MAAQNGHGGREVLPVPDRRYAGLVTYDAKDPDTSFPPIEPHPAARRGAERARRPARRRRLRRVERVRRRDRHAERRAPRRRRPQVQPLPHDGAVLADARGAAQRPQPPHGRDGRHHRDRHLGARLQLAPARTTAPRSRRSSSSTATRPPSSASATRCRSGRRARWGRSTTGRRAAASSTSTGSSAARPTSTTPRSTRAPTPVEPERHARGGLPPHGRHDRQGDQLGAAAEVADAGQAVLRLLRAGRDPRPAPRAAEWADKYAGRFDAGWDALREEIFARQKELGVIPDDRGAHAPARRDPRLGRHARGAQARPPPPDGGLRGLPRVHRPPRRPPVRRARGPRGVRQHARLLHHRRQRRLGRGHA